MRRKVAAKKVAAEEREPEKERFSERVVSVSKPGKRFGSGGVDGERGFVVGFVVDCDFVTVIDFVSDSVFDFVVDFVFDCMVDCVIDCVFDCVIDCVFDCVFDFIFDFTFDFTFDITFDLILDSESTLPLDSSISRWSTPYTHNTTSSLCVK